jgi:hypothetical protein
MLLFCLSLKGMQRRNVARVKFLNRFAFFFELFGCQETARKQKKKREERNNWSFRLILFFKILALQSNAQASYI